MAGTVYQFPPSVKVKSGDTVTMHCQLNEVQSFCHTVAWVRVNPVSGIIDILHDANISSQTKDVDENPVCQASIYNAAVQDSGTYYCIATDRELMYLGNGTAVNVHGTVLEHGGIRFVLIRKLRFLLYNYVSILLLFYLIKIYLSSCRRQHCYAVC